MSIWKRGFKLNIQDFQWNMLKPILTSIEQAYIGFKYYNIYTYIAKYI